MAELYIHIPKEFEAHFNFDRFVDSLTRLMVDAHCLAGNYEKETAAMLIEVFKKAIPAADVVERKNGSWIEDGYFNEPCVCSYCGEPCKDTVMGKPRWIYCPLCGSKNQEGSP